MTRPILMMEAEKSPNSPLGFSSPTYQTKRSETGSILDQPALGLLEFYPAGYTKDDAIGASRQEVYKALYERSVKDFKESLLYPIGKARHNLLIVPDKDNKYDPHAMRIQLEVFDHTDPLYKYNGRDLGFVPMKITAALSPNLKMIKYGRILKVRNAVHGKYYSAKAIFSYGDEDFCKLDKTSSSRFIAIMED